MKLRAKQIEWNSCGGGIEGWLPKSRVVFVFITPDDGWPEPAVKMYLWPSDESYEIYEMESLDAAKARAQELLDEFVNEIGEVGE